jgi:serine protease Do
MDRRWILGLLVIVSSQAVRPVFADVTPELLRQIRASTFEVVMKKPTVEAVRYEKPLPLDLLPYIERTDLYRSLGTAFAISPNTYVTAAHVLIAGIDSQFGPPALRMSDGTVHSIANILAFEASEDFVVFSLTDAQSSVALPTNRSPHVDDAVLAVGNALGDGIVVRDGLFTSETAEEQDGRWKWIRFSAAASPGNSGGPLLDSSGKIIGVVIAKSPNENLNYALPIARVLDTVPAKARFDQRALTRLPFLQGSQTYSMKDEFMLPLNWETFARSYQALVARHADHAREALLATYASTMFPRGNGSEAILFDSDPTSRTPGVVLQQADGTWTVQVPDLQFTDLPGDGKVGFGSVAGIGLLALHRGNEGDDDGFYADSKSFMDIALKALNLRRQVGSDQVRVVSLGAAASDIVTMDASGRKWQVRVWPVPFIDMYLVTQLLPTPDGYIGLVAYAPSSILREVKAQLSLLANQATLTYVGTTKQWQAFLARPALLPETLKDVRLESNPQWKLHTPRFEMRMPPDLMQIDSHSELLLGMNFTQDGPKVIWGVGGAWWYRDAQEKAYVGLWRAPRPPATAKLETRTRFDDLQARRSPYDGSPVRASSDTINVQMGIQAPGAKDGLASSGVAYGLTMQLDGHLAPPQIALAETAAIQATHILERAIGPDVAAAAPVTVSAPLNGFQIPKTISGAQLDERGKDLRGRLFSDDVSKYVLPLIQNGSAQGAYSEVMGSVMQYWDVAPGVISNRDLWQSFLLHNHFPENTPHSAEVIAAESALQNLLVAGTTPNSEWTTRSRALTVLYVKERQSMIFKAAQDAAGSLTFHPRRSGCPAPTDHTSGTGRPKLATAPSSLDAYYPPDLRKRNIQGSVIVSLKVNSSGCATEIAVAGSSGAEEFDEAALSWVETASFLAGEKDGKAIDATTQLVVTFTEQ